MEKAAGMEVRWWHVTSLQRAANVLLDGAGQQRGPAL